jgi:hypothetical protein
MSRTNYLQTFKFGLQRTAGPYRCATRRLAHRNMVARAEARPMVAGVAVAAVTVQGFGREVIP